MINQRTTTLNRRIALLEEQLVKCRRDFYIAAILAFVFGYTLGKVI